MVEACAELRSVSPTVMVAVASPTQVALPVVLLKVIDFVQAAKAAVGSSCLAGSGSAFPSLSELTVPGPSTKTSPFAWVMRTLLPVITAPSRVMVTGAPNMWATPAAGSTVSLSPEAINGGAPESVLLLT